MDPHRMGSFHSEMVRMAGIQKKKDEKEKMGEMHQRNVEKIIKSAEGSAGLLHKITKPTMWRGGVQILKEEEEDARLLDRCEAKRKEWESIGNARRKCRIRSTNHGGTRN